MWFCKKKTLAESGFFPGFVDWHCHLLPGVDDGVDTFEEALHLLAEYERLGIREVWLTPHIMEDVPNTPARLRERFTELQAAYAGSVRLHLAAEHMLDRLFLDRLAQDDLVLLGENNRRILVETSYFHPPLDLYGLLKRIQSQGYSPVLAHPERYEYMEAADYSHLKSQGIRFQLNLGSLCGRYGPAARRKAHRLLEARHYDYIGTDLHSITMWKALLQEKFPPTTLARLKQIPCFSLDNY